MPAGRAIFAPLQQEPSYRWVGLQTDGPLIGLRRDGGVAGPGEQPSTRRPVATGAPSSEHPRPPVDLPFDEKKDLPDIGKAYGAKPLAVLCDGSVRTLDLTTLSATTLKAAITRAGGEVLGSDW